jgi:hypothetical protein
MREADMKCKGSIFMFYRHPMNKDKETDNEERPLLHGN